MVLTSFVTKAVPLCTLFSPSFLFTLASTLSAVLLRQLALVAAGPCTERRASMAAMLLNASLRSIDLERAGCMERSGFGLV